MLEIVVYQDADAARPFELWFNRLDDPAAARITNVIRRMSHGNLCDVKYVGGGVLERRIDWGPGYRIYFGRDGTTLVVLLGGDTKKHQRRDIAYAQRRWTDYRNRKSWAKPD
jgi:putative addiction module killer protein